MEATLRESKREKRANKKGPITDNDHLGKMAAAAAADAATMLTDMREIYPLRRPVSPSLPLRSSLLSHSLTTLGGGTLRDCKISGAPRRRDVGTQVHTALHWLELGKR